MKTYDFFLESEMTNKIIKNLPDYVGSKLENNYRLYVYGMNEIDYKIWKKTYRNLITKMAEHK